MGASLLAIHSKAFESLSLAGQAPTKDEAGRQLRAKAFRMV
jgi:hypothetical protein